MKIFLVLYGKAGFVGGHYFCRNSCLRMSATVVEKSYPIKIVERDCLPSNATPGITYFTRMDDGGIRGRTGKIVLCHVAK